MKIIVACDSFKGCMSSKEVEESIKKGILKANNKHEVLTFPMADGGEGTAMVFCDIIQGKTIDVLTVDAYGKNVFTTYCISQDGQLAIMDVASCIGLNMTPKEKRSLAEQTSSFISSGAEYGDLELMTCPTVKLRSECSTNHAMPKLASAALPPSNTYIFSGHTSR